MVYSNTAVYGGVPNEYGKSGPLSILLLFWSTNEAFEVQLCLQGFIGYSILSQKTLMPRCL